VLNEENGTFVIVERNLFYPRGGGQKGDRGAIIAQGAEYPVRDTIKDPYSEEGVLLVVEQSFPEQLEGSVVTCRLDWEFRYGQMRLHSALHLHHCLLEKALGAALSAPKTADIQDGFAFNRYEDSAITSESVDRANDDFRALVAKGVRILTYPDPEKPGFRYWECLTWRIPCGGTHVADAREIGELAIAYSKKKKKPTITFRLPGTAPVEV
jgi:alanyl-tRNA synthetase/misacylated tRNA(Ala) deacylase